MLLVENFRSNKASFCQLNFMEIVLVGELVMDFHDVAFLPSRTSFFTTFLNKCGRGEGLVTATCLKTVLG